MATQPQALTTNPTTSIRKLLDSQKQQIAVALPKNIGVDADKLIRVAMTAINDSPKLQKCDPVTVLQAVIQAAQVGLVPDGFLGQAYLVPFVNGRRGNRLEAKLMLGYRGLIQIASRGGAVSVSADVVYEGDKFIYRKGTNAMLEHIPTLEVEKRGKIIGGYAVAKFAHGDTAFEVMAKGDIDAIRKSSKAGDDGPWDTHYSEMARKTVVRRLIKYLPVNPEAVRAAVVDEYTEAGIVLEGNPETGEVTTPAAVPENSTSRAAQAVQERVAEIRKKNPDLVTATEIPAPAPVAPAPQTTKPAEPKPEEKTMSMEGEIYSISNTRKNSRGNTYIVITMKGMDDGIFVYDTKWIDAMLQVRPGTKVYLSVARSGKYFHMKDAYKIGNTEYHEGVPVIQRNTPPEEVIEQAEANLEPFQPTEDPEVPF